MPVFSLDCNSAERYNLIGEIPIPLSLLNPEEKNMKNVLVTLPLDESYRTQLAAIAGDAYSLQFMNPQENRDAYIKALEQANVILGEPNTEDLQFCRHLEWMQIT